MFRRTASSRPVSTGPSRDQRRRRTQGAETWLSKASLPVLKLAPGAPAAGRRGRLQDPRRPGGPRPGSRARRSGALVTTSSSSLAFVVATPGWGRPRRRSSTLRASISGIPRGSSAAFLVNVNMFIIAEAVILAASSWRSFAASRARSSSRSAPSRLSTPTSSAPSHGPRDLAPRLRRLRPRNRGRPGRQFFCAVVASP